MFVPVVDGRNSQMVRRWTMNWKPNLEATAWLLFWQAQRSCRRLSTRYLVTDLTGGSVRSEFSRKSKHQSAPLRFFDYIVIYGDSRWNWGLSPNMGIKETVFLKQLQVVRVNRYAHSIGLQILIAFCQDREAIGQDSWPQDAGEKSQIFKANKNI